MRPLARWRFVTTFGHTATFAIKPAADPRHRERLGAQARGQNLYRSEGIGCVMVSRSQIEGILDDYEDITIATVWSHSSLQIFHGARQEGFRSLGIAVGSQPRYYDAFPLAKPDEFLVVDSYKDIPDHADQLVAKNVITVPHGSFVEYLGADRFAKMAVPTFGNREVLKWETDREKQREWLTSAGGNMPGGRREWLLPAALAMGERVVERALDLFGGMIGPFCLETIVQDDLKFRVFEISSRIVAGTNLFVTGSPYSDLAEPGMSTGRRIAREIKLARKAGRLMDVVS